MGGFPLDVIPAQAGIHYEETRGQGGLRRAFGIHPDLASACATVAGTHGRAAEQERDRGHEAGDPVALALVLLSPHVCAGVRLSELDRIVEEFIRSEGGKPTYKGYRPSSTVPPFPGSICSVVNEEVVHGIPGPRRLRDGEIVGIDVGATLGGWVDDTCYMYPVGEISPRAGKLLDVATECLKAGISEVGPGKRFGDVGAAIQELAEYGARLSRNRLNPHRNRGALLEQTSSRNARRMAGADLAGNHDTCCGPYKLAIVDVARSPVLLQTSPQTPRPIEGFKSAEFCSRLGSL